jgi:hypothetical protein
MMLDDEVRIIRRSRRFLQDCPAIAGRKDRVAGHFYGFPQNPKSAPIAPAIYRLALAPRQQFTVNSDRSRVRWLLIRKTSKIVDMLRPCRLALASSFRSSR